MTGETYLTRTVRFSAAHRYHRSDWSEARNREAFGACSNPHGHGHNYLLEVMVAGRPDGETGFSVDLPALDDVLRQEVVARMDHQHVNHAIPDFREGGLIPSTENLVIFLWERIAPKIPAPLDSFGYGFERTWISSWTIMARTARQTGESMLRGAADAGGYWIGPADEKIGAG